MALDSQQERMSAIDVDCPWRGPLVDPTESGTTQGNRQAAAYLYAGILALTPIVDDDPNVYKRPFAAESVWPRTVAEPEFDGPVFKRPPPAETVVYRRI